MNEILLVLLVLLVGVISFTLGYMANPRWHSNAETGFEVVTSVELERKANGGRILKLNGKPFNYALLRDGVAIEHYDDDLFVLTLDLWVSTNGADK